jgi:fatty acid desaturase
MGLVNVCHRLKELRSRLKRSRNPFFKDTNAGVMIAARTIRAIAVTVVIAFVVAASVKVDRSAIAIPVMVMALSVVAVIAHESFCAIMPDARSPGSR